MSEDATDIRFEEHYSNLIKNNNTRYEIIMAIRNFGALNVKTLADLIGKVDSTIFHHVSELLKEPKIIEIDIEKTERERGKFFNLSEKTKELFSDDKNPYISEIPRKIDQHLSLDPEVLRKTMIASVKEIESRYESLAPNIKKSLGYHHIVEKYILREIQEAASSIKNNLTPKQNIPFPTATNLSINIKISSLHHVLRIAKVTNDYFRKLVELKEEIEKELDSQNIKEENILTEYIHVFGGEFGRFEFGKD
jgi:hypothetical protein